MKSLSEFWGAIYFGTQKIGRLHQCFGQRPDKHGIYTSTWETFLAFERGGDLVEFREQASVSEHADGKVDRYNYILESFAGDQPMTSATIEGVVAGDKLLVNTGGYEQELPAPNGSRGPRAMLTLLLDARKRGEGYILTDTVFAPELGRGVGLHVEFGPREDVQLRDGTQSLQRVTQTMAIRPNHPDVQWLDDIGHAIVTRVQVPMLGPVQIYRCTREDALIPATPVELMAAAMLPSPTPIAEPRQQETARYRVRYAQGTGTGIWRGENQTMRELEPETAEIDITPLPADSELDGYTVPITSATELGEFLQATAFLEADAPLIKEMAREAAGSETDSVTLARHLESYVRNKIQDKTLDMGFATALETAKALRGDCSEHSVLVAALARALGIPSRLVVGVAYVSNVAYSDAHRNGAFVFHVWAELLVTPDTWLPVDPALGRFDATHIALTKSPLGTASPMADLCLPVLEIVDSLRIENVQLGTVLPSPQR